MRWDFKDKCVLVTGGTSGIGLGICRAFDAAGASVTGVGIGSDEIDAASNELPSCSFEEVDVQSLEDLRRIHEKMKRLDCLINCAGIIRRNKAEFESDEFARVVNINLNGTANACFVFRDLLSEQNGAVVNTASMYSIFGSGFVPAYSASKGGISQLTKSLAIAWAEDGIRVNAVAPGWIETPLTQPLRDDSDRNSQIVGRTPMGRWGTPADVAAAVLFLCSDAAQFITGAQLPVDGGYSIA